MTLSKQEINALLRLIGLTQDEELNCEQCASHVAEFADRELSGKSVSGALEAVAHHLSICVECREEYDALRRALKELNP